MQTYILVGLFFCHFLADFTHLSTNWMLSAKRLGTPLLPIYSHAFIHGITMFLFLLFVGIHYEIASLLFLLQVSTHFLIDVWKGKMNYWFPTFQSPENKFHWWLFGFDQYLHVLVIVLMSYIAVTLSI